jgi:hypothetical protein
MEGFSRLFIFNENSHRSKFVRNKKIAFTDPEALKGIIL